MVDSGRSNSDGSLESSRPILGLTWDCVDLDNSIIHVRQSLKRERGMLRIGTLKTDRSLRSLRAPEVLVNAIRHHRARILTETLAGEPGWNELNLVFPSEAGDLVDPSNFRRAFNSITKRAGLGRWKPYELRHSMVSILSAAGVPIERIADVAGNDPTVSGGVYRHVIEPEVDYAASPMQDLFGYGTVQ